MAVEIDDLSREDHLSEVEDLIVLTLGLENILLIVEGVEGQGKFVLTLGSWNR